MRLSEKLRSLHSNVYLNLNKSARQDLLQAADLLDATTPRPWPPPAGVTRCLGWDKYDKEWCVLAIEDGEWIFDLTPEPAWKSCPVWLPMPPEPEVGG